MPRHRSSLVPGRRPGTKLTGPPDAPGGPLLSGNRIKATKKSRQRSALSGQSPAVAGTRQNQQMTDPDRRNENPVLLIGPGEPGAAPSLTFRISPDYSDALTSRLDGEGIRYGTVLELSAGTELAQCLVYIGGSAGVLTGVAAVIRAVCHGDDGKQFKIKTKDAEYSGRGLSVDEIVRLLEAARGEEPDDGTDD